MFLDYFKLAEEPFGVTPDSRFLYLGNQHREALASLVYGIESNRGFLAVIAKPGMGKTSLLYHFMEYLRGRARTAFVFQTDCDSREFIRHVLMDLGIDATGKDLPAMHEALNQVLAQQMQAGKRFVLIIDEAQNLEDKVLESVRLLSNFETPWMKLVQIVIAGQPGLAEKLNQPSMTQLRQRISLIIRVAPFNRHEINAYIDHRLSIAGCKDPGLFTVGARALIAEHSEGIPRKINNICFNAMSLACALKRTVIDDAIVREVLADLDLESLIEKPPAPPAPPTTGTREEQPIQVTSAPQRLREKQKPWFQDLALRLAMVGTLVLAVVTGVNNGEVRASSNTANTGVKTDSPIAQQPPVSLQSPGESETVEPSPGQEPRSVRLSQGQTLYRICVAKFGRYDAEILTEIRNLNPWLSDPTQIPSGQEIFIPSAPMSPVSSQNPASQELPTHPQEMEKNE